MKKGSTIVLLGGNYRERAPAAAEAFHSNAGREILLANDGILGAWSNDYQRNLYQVEWAEELLVRNGVSRDRIVKLPFYGSSTMNDALAVKLYAVEHKTDSMIIVTSDYHMRRSLWAFRTAFSGQPISIAAYPSKSSDVGAGGRALEFCKAVYYRMRFGLLGIMPKTVVQRTFETGPQEEKRSAPTRQ
jgi:uncharacterized SAM-binding protein YcdF (DUF218 family)